MCRILNFSAVGLFVLGFGAQPLSTAEKSEKSDPAAIATERVLRRETIGPLNRRTELVDILEKHPDSTAARWSAGYVRDGKSWRSFDDAALSPTMAGKLQRYKEKRMVAPATGVAELGLANWCRQQGLRDQERAHLINTIIRSSGTDHSATLGRLGYRRVGGSWLSQDEIADWAEQNEQTEAALRFWSPRVNALVKGLTGSPGQHDDAVRELQKITDPAVIPAFEIASVELKPALAIDLLQMVSKFKEHAASTALARQAVFSGSAEVRTMAATALKTRRFEDFVPALIHLLATPAEYQPIQIQYSNRGVLYYGHVISRETDSEIQVARLQAVCRLVPVYTRVIASRRRGQNLDIAANAPRLNQASAERVLSDVSRAIADKQRLDEAAVARRNDEAATLNGKVIFILSEISGEQRTDADDLQGWWNWWYSYADVQKSGPKPVIEVSESEEQRVAVPQIQIQMQSCFAAGTPVCTESGRIPIEEIKPGDRVLCKDIDTGELAFKAVVQTSIRPPKELVTLRIGGETITATSGHRFWVSGEGWVKARDLKPQSLVHTVTGNAPVWSVANGPTAATYNLVVDDFHDYFVGQAGMLVQDLPLPRPTDCVVPGLPRRRLVATNSP